MSTPCGFRSSPRFSFIPSDTVPIPAGGPCPAPEQLLCPSPGAPSNFSSFLPHRKEAFLSSSSSSHSISSSIILLACPFFSPPLPPPSRTTPPHPSQWPPLALLLLAPLPPWALRSLALLSALLSRTLLLSAPLPVRIAGETTQLALVEPVECLVDPIENVNSDNRIL